MSTNHAREAREIIDDKRSLPVALARAQVIATLEVGRQLKAANLLTVSGGKRNDVIDALIGDEPQRQDEVCGKRFSPYGHTTYTCAKKRNHIGGCDD